MTNKTAVARKPKGHFSVERQMYRRMHAKDLRDLKNAPDSRRNPVEQLHKALFGYFFPPRKKYHMLLRKILHIGSTNSPGNPSACLKRKAGGNLSVRLIVGQRKPLRQLR